jgi:glutathione S-transferase
MSLIFYYAPWSSASTCHWALEELGVPYEKVKLDLKAGDAKKPAFLALNPNAKVPVLVHDGTPIFESIAILMHLGETFGVKRTLFPAAGIERGLAFQWLAWSNVSLGPAAHRYMSSNGDAKAEAKEALFALVAMLGKALEGRTWLVGDTFTLVDLHLAGALSWIATSGFDVTAVPGIEGWLSRCKSRPSFAVNMAA